MTKVVTELAKTSYACRLDAENAVKNWYTKQKPLYHQFNIEITEETVTEKRSHRGWPRNGETSGTKTVYRLTGQIVGRDETTIRKAYDLARTFILITSDRNIPAVEVLRNYKDQYKVEQRFGFLKDPYYVGPLFLKKEERIKGLHHVLLLTLLIYCLFERRTRLNLKRKRNRSMLLEATKPLPRPE